MSMFDTACTTAPSPAAAHRHAQSVTVFVLFAAVAYGQEVSGDGAEVSGDGAEVSGGESYPPPRLCHLPHISPPLVQTLPTPTRWMEPANTVNTLSLKPAEKPAERFSMKPRGVSPRA